MKTYKQIDFWGSIILIIGSIAATFIWSNFIYIIGYFIVGAWQLLSIIVHEINHWFIRKGGNRRLYHKIVLSIFLSLIAGLCICLVSSLGYSFVLIILSLLLCISPILAVCYIIICYNELFVAIPKRELAHLK
jgi:hypothetical protein